MDSFIGLNSYVQWFLDLAGQPESLSMFYMMFFWSRSLSMICVWVIQTGATHWWNTSRFPAPGMTIYISVHYHHGSLDSLKNFMAHLGHISWHFSWMVFLVLLCWSACQKILTGSTCESATTRVKVDVLRNDFLAASHKLDAILLLLNLSSFKESLSRDCQHILHNSWPHRAAWVPFPLLQFSSWMCIFLCVYCHLGLRFRWTQSFSAPPLA